jgi:hypothetical protein
MVLSWLKTASGKPIARDIPSMSAARSSGHSRMTDEEPRLFRKHNAFCGFGE